MQSGTVRASPRQRHVQNFGGVPNWPRVDAMEHGHGGIIDTYRWTPVITTSAPAPLPPDGSAPIMAYDVCARSMTPSSRIGHSQGFTLPACSLAFSQPLSTSERTTASLKCSPAAARPRTMPTG